MDITAARKALESFFIDELAYTKAAVQVIGLSRVTDGWEARVCVTETNRLLRELGYPPVYDRSVYYVKMNDNLEVVTYWTGEDFEGEDEIGTGKKHR